MLLRLKIYVVVVDVLFGPQPNPSCLKVFFFCERYELDSVCACVRANLITT